MAGYADVNIVSVNVGALSNANRPMFKVPTGFGGLSVQTVNVNSAGTSSSALYIVYLDTTGGTIQGTVATLGTVSIAANVPQAFVVGTPYVAEGKWVAVKEANVGAVNANTVIDMAYIIGK